MSEVTTPDLNAILAPLLTKFHLIRNTRFDNQSGRAEKHKMRMKTWTSNDPNDGFGVFVYEDNTVGLKGARSNEVELDLVASDPDFCTKLESWLNSNKVI